MHYVVLKMYRWYGGKLDQDKVKKIVPNAKCFNHDDSTQHFIIQYFKILDEDTNYLVIEVDSLDDALELKAKPIGSLLVGNAYVSFAYIFGDINRDKLDKEFIQLKLTGDSGYKEDHDVASKASIYQDFSRKYKKLFNLFLSDKHYFSPEFVKAMTDANTMFEAEHEAFKKARAKAKKEATKFKTSFRAKFIKYAVVKC